MKTLFLTVCFTLICIAGLHAQLVIDNFNTGAFTLNGPAGYQSNITAPGAVAGYRNAIVLGQNATATIPSQMSLNTADGFLKIAEGDNNDYTYCSWGNTTFDPASPTSLNLNVSAYNAIVVKLLEAPSEGALQVILYKDNGVLYDAFDLAVKLSGSGEYILPLSSFTGADLTDIDGIELYFNNQVTPLSTIKVDYIQFQVASTPPIAMGFANPNPVTSGTATLLTVKVALGENPLSTGIVVTADLSSIGGAATQSLVDNGTNGDVTAGDNIFSFSYTLPLSTATGSYSLPVTVADAQSRSSSTSIALDVLSTPPPLMIDDFNTGAFTLSGPAGYRNNITSAGAIAGYRNAIVLAQNGISPAPSIMSLNPADGFLRIKEGGNNDYTYLSWGNTTFDPPSPTSLNLNASAYNAIVVKLLEAPSEGVLQIYLNKDNGPSYDAYTSSKPLNGPGVYVLPLNAFAGADLTDIDGIELYFNNRVSPGTTIKVDYIRLEVAAALPVIVTQPTSANVCALSAATFTVEATGSTLTYKWQQSDNPGFTAPVFLSNQGVYSGTNSKTLTIKDAAGLNGKYFRCFVENTSGTVISNGAPLTVNVPTLPANAQSVTQPATTNTFQTNSCLLLGKVVPLGAAPVTGNITFKVWNEADAGVYRNIDFVRRHYEVMPENNAAAATARITLYFTQADFDNFNAVSGIALPTNPSDAAGKANLRISKLSGTSSNGTGLPDSYPGAGELIDPVDADIVWNATNNWWEISFDNTGFSGYFIQTDGIVLPLRLISFTAMGRQDGKVQLNWKVAEQRGVLKYEIERSANPSQFEKVGTVGAVVAVSQDYSHIDETPAAKTWYYRLKMIDVDGKISYSQVVAVNLSRQGSSVSVYPNPVKNYLKVYSTNLATVLNARLLNASGQVLRQLVINSATYEMNMSMLADGIYFLSLDNGTVIRIVKQQ